MNKFFKLVYVNLLDLFDINKIIIAREDGVKSNLEKRTILVALINVVYAYFLYVILNQDFRLHNSVLINDLGSQYTSLIQYIKNRALYLMSHI